MHRRSFAMSMIAGLVMLAPATLAAQTARLPERAVRRDIPMTNMIRRAHAAGTRDSTGRPGPNYWQLWTEYTINARLDTATSTISGRETIVIHNTSDSAMTSVVMRLDPNLYRPKVSRGASVPAETTDGMIITRLSVNGQAVDLAATGGRGGRGGGGAAAPRQTTVSGLQQTSARITLADPIAAKSKATLDLDWNFRVPGGPGGQGHRMTMRWADTLYQLTQWYPRVTVYDDLRGWDTDVYLGPSEFYNNFGRFDVRLDVPAGWLVGATGVLRNPEQVLTPTARQRLTRILDSDSTITIVGADEVGPGRSTAPGTRLVWHFVADSVNDFAWASAARYTWHATRATIPRKGPVPLHMFYLPGSAGSFTNAASLSRHALEYYSSLWIPYPFPQMTMLDGPSAGMEYPMVINSNQGAADHETGHQWWPMTVGTNETWYGWMDEGFNQYMNILSDAHRTGRAPRLDGLGQSYGRTSGDEREGPLMWNANYGGPMYGFQAYSKAPLMLSMLGGVVGDSAVTRAMSQYAEAWRFKHPSPWDYMFFMNKALGQDLGWFWYYWLFTTESVDGSIERAIRTGNRTHIVVRQDGQMPSPVVLGVRFAPTGAPIRLTRNARMVDSVTAVVTYPVDVWFAGSRTFETDLDFGGRAIERITLDPFGRFPDRDPSDNVWPKSGAATRAPGGE